MADDKAFFDRTEQLLGCAAMERLQASRVLLFGVGGVGGWCAEGLIRSGIGHLTIVDSAPKGTMMPVTATFGLTLASLVIRDAARR